MNKELREAAERFINPSMIATSVEGGKPEWKMDVNYWDVRDIVKSYLMEHQLDDNEPIDWEWLQEQKDVRLAYPDLIVVQNPVLTIKIHCTMDGRSLDITRGQVRLLLRALA